ncbi:hypothetical protein [Shewanella sp. CG12_big_fil_rev_8_21_14_0_65_47_15]|uniref:hypothetical protein n=1 Tax=Shewanella sp. CG12_big_fil_rev_8_21_14_0_65_47_15 TaxID=1975537 RepID=UPI000CBFCF2D|nr:hypothetical protein [Shewanella sp. CG12_big_fil_rev_8_21_14_0_65_47_15]PIW61774.1 MAG: hypothetical protein COW15_06205 [Shewanella sp. CG12_big_fil_rev_8_21_14_0_65_47_15]
MKKLMLSMLIALGSSQAMAHGPGGIHTEKSDTQAAFDLVHTRVFKDGTHLVFEQIVTGMAGADKPKSNGKKFATADVFSYVWPTALDSEVIGFEGKKGIVALALTAHPDFDDTPLYDENNDGNLTNDGDDWHAHWVVLTPDEACGPKGLKVRDIPAGETPKVPKTWPGAPIYIDSPGYDFSLKQNTVAIRVPLKEVGFPTDFNYDGVTAALKINANLHNPLLCVVNVYDIASGDLSLPGRWSNP